MTTPTAASTLTTEASAAIAGELGETGRFAERRARAAALATELLLPDPQRERPWKYFDPRTLEVDALDPRPPAAAVSAQVLAERFALDPHTYAGTAIEANGRLLHLVANDPAVSLFELPSPSAPDTVAERYGTVVPVERSRLTAIHYAFARGGLAVVVAPNAEPDAPVRILRWYEGENALFAPHTLIVTGANSRLSVIEDCRSGDGRLVVLPVTEILPGPGSEVRYTVLHRWGARTWVFAEQRTVTEQDAALVSLAVATGGRLVKVHVESSLVGRGSSSELYALTFGNDEEHVDFFTLQDHVGPDTRSDLLFKSALRDHARAVYYGLTRVGLGARNADANQENRNLLLSKTAKADSDPQLEIFTNDVIRASHGATAGPVDEEQLFYLQSRGIPRHLAEELLVWAFLGEVLDRLPDDRLRTEIERSLQAKLER